MIILAVTLVGAVNVGSVHASEGLVELVDPLDEPERYCLDVRGFGRRLNLEAPLMAHTCKPGAPDELFTWDHPDPGQLYMKAYDRCVTAESSQAGAEVFVRECDSSASQRFSFEPNGWIKLAGSELCLTVADGKGTRAGGPSHLRRDLTLETCGSEDSARSRWRLP